MQTPDVRLFADLNALSVAAAEAAVVRVNETVRATGRCSVVLSGGNTPRTLHGLLASRWRDRVPWENVQVFWGDERYVPHGDRRSNYRMAKETLLDHVPCPPRNVHSMPTNFDDRDEAARAYEATLHSHFGGGPPRFDLVFLGLGEDGHTASIFPGSPAVAERARWTMAVITPADPPLRLTLTLSALAHARAIYFLVAGSKKAHALSQVLTATADANVCPAAGIRLDGGTTTWWVDRDAAGKQSHGD